MYVVIPQTVTESMLLASSVPETDYPVWSSSSSYSLGQRVILTTGYHKVYECIAANTNRNPATDVNRLSYWFEVSSTNRWKPFDKKLSAVCQSTSDIIIDINPSELCNAIALFGLAASSVTVEVFSDSTLVSSTTLPLIDRIDSVGWYNWFYEPIKYDSEAVILTFSASIGNVLRITISGTGTVEVGEIVIGRNRLLGETLVGTEPGFRDYSRKEQDEQGEWTVIERGYSEFVDFNFAFPSANARSVGRLLQSVRAQPCVFHAGSENTQFGTTIYGYFTSLSTPITHRNKSFSTLRVEGLK